VGICGYKGAGLLRAFWDVSIGALLARFKGELQRRAPKSNHQEKLMEALSLWRPFRDLERLARSWETRFPGFPEAFEAGEKEFAPPIESFVKDGNLVVRADVPGLEPKDIGISVLQDVLTIKGER
jgi:HSP20 family molecular chaperone IbpA